MENIDDYKLKRNIICIDLKSFYASVECILRDLNPDTTPLVVADKARGNGSIVLAVTPYLKNQGVPSRCRIFELPGNLDIIYARPQMEKYLEYSTKVIETYLEFVSEEDLYVYSIDEAFLDVTNYLNYYNLKDYEIAVKILSRIYEKLSLKATAGVGPNMLIAKLAMDIEAKHVLNNLAVWNYDNIEEKLWPVTPLSKMWGIGRRMEHHLNLLGLNTVGDIANYSKKSLKRRFGILGEELYYHTHGIDMSMIKDKDILRKKVKSIGTNQVLFKDYYGDNILIIILEIVDDITRRLRLARKRAKTITLSVMYSKESEGGFSRQISLDTHTQNESVIYKTCLDIFDLYYENYPIRKVGVSLTNLTDSLIAQYSLFDDIESLENETKSSHTLDKLKVKYGKNSVLRGSSLEDDSTVKDRNKQIGGHHV